MTMVKKHTGVARTCHFLHLVSMLLLILSGLNISYPSGFNVFGSLNTARMLHFIFMYLITFTFIYRVYYSLASGDIKEIVFPTRKAIRDIPAMIGFYLFLKPKHPDFGKYNPGQRATYFGWWILLIIQAFTGFALYWSTKLAWVIDLAGGLRNVRVIHFVACWLFIITVALHFYLGAVLYPFTLTGIITGSQDKEKEEKYVEHAPVA